MDLRYKTLATPLQCSCARDLPLQAILAPSWMSFLALCLHCNHTIVARFASSLAHLLSRVILLSCILAQDEPLFLITQAPRVNFLYTFICTPQNFVLFTFIEVLVLSLRFLLGLHLSLWIPSWLHFKLSFILYCQFLIGFHLLPLQLLAFWVKHFLSLWFLPLFLVFWKLSSVAHNSHSFAIVVGITKIYSMV